VIAFFPWLLIIQIERFPNKRDGKSYFLFMNTSLPPEILTESVPPKAASQNPASEQQTQQPIMLLLGCAIVFCFFLPWVQIKFFAAFNLSGFDLQKDGGKLWLFWLVPFFGLTSIIATLTRSSANVAGRLAGASPFGVLAYGLYQFGPDLFESLQFGAYIGLLAGLLLFAISCLPNPSKP
jgi:4-amino-4-deoxy-L-arabinose transferase-like glycosyltransferase